MQYCNSVMTSTVLPSGTACRPLIIANNSARLLAVPSNPVDQCLITSLVTPSRIIYAAPPSPKGYCNYHQCRLCNRVSHHKFRPFFFENKLVYSFLLAPIPPSFILLLLNDRVDAKQHRAKKKDSFHITNRIRPSDGCDFHPCDVRCCNRYV